MRNFVRYARTALTELAIALPFVGVLYFLAR